ncbi:hypothetical protein CHLRE_04g217910v5 [Chlamydomonas reinhardtii]|uniref:Uncharacterized protein n=1 Tax=Chlamydomonas reinhardtii TaxID=3055 RepID=A8JEQ7_CHLRE|nr:uncharacterized protein CHLRE_04g217910v5 [Chlamydomonas reinhardtii]PNW83803.1 hypothetical protein CHLRE_04g217910v5 [Chlamydomonas reinhardtii]|eukprot:XP_001701280.1 predicted protein [Chlamydomonas reinhardtii]
MSLTMHRRPVAGISSRKPSVRVAALFGKPKASTTTSGSKSGSSARITGRAPVLADPVDFEQVGFRFDPANNRWLRDDRFAGKFDQTLATPKSGTPYVVWPAIHTLLVSKGLRSVTPEEARILTEEQGWTLVDVRLGDDYLKNHAEGAISLPIYRYVEGTGFWDNVKKAAMAVGFAMRATERDPGFADKALGQLKKNQKVVLMCAIGGTLDTLLNLRQGVKAAIRDPERAFGRESRSLKAAYELINAGWDAKNIYWVEGGLQQWRFRGLPTEGTKA